MAVLSAKARKSLATSDFAVPGKRAYPMEDRNHAKAALSLGARYASPGEYAKIKAKAKSKFGMK